MRKVVFAAFLPWFATAMAAPLPPFAAVDVCGAIVSQSWVAEAHLKAIPGASGSLGQDRTVPAHARVVLADVIGADSDVMSQMSNYAGAAAGEVPRGGILLLLAVPTPDGLAAAKSLCVTGYKIRGDEGITLTSFESLAVK